MDHFTVVSWNLELTFLCCIAKTISFLNDNRWQSDEKMSCKNGNALSSTTFSFCCPESSSHPVA